MNKTKFRALLEEKEFIILDGAMGTELQKRGMKAGESPDALNFTAPDMVAGVIRSYAEAGADIVSMNTFGVNRYKLFGKEKTPEETVIQAAKVARGALEGYPDVLLAIDISPIGQLLQPAGTLKFEEAYDMFAEVVTAGEKAGADLIFFQTFSDLLEMKAALLAAKENSALHVICSMTFEENGRAFSGCPVSAMGLTLEGLGADAIGINCSVGPKEAVNLIKELSEYSSIPIIIKPNAGLPDLSGKHNMPPDEFVSHMLKTVQFGAKLLGGCCGTSPEYIKALSAGLKGMKSPSSKRPVPAAVCSGTRTVILNSPAIIGERINPTGKKLLKEALEKEDTGYILKLAVGQTGSGADILDVNVGHPGTDEKKMMIRAVKAIQGVTDLPLQIDSSDGVVIGEALRAYNGKPVVNSVNGDKEVLEAVLPHVKKYGAAVVGLTLDKDGIPDTAEKRLEIAERILNKALSYGIRREDVYIDCLTLTVSAEPEQAAVTLKALKLIKERLGLKTVLGVSNVSFGLPRRELINSAFLLAALENGLDLPIINPDALSGMVMAFRALRFGGVNSFVSAYSGKPEEKTSAPQVSAGLGYAIENGLKEEAAAETVRLLDGGSDPMEIINGELIPALDRVGDGFEKGRVFLPQLLMSAGAAQEASEAIKKRLGNSSGPVKKGRIVLATVKGDIHDIGKNIVKVLLENYGYDVVDLGKDVPPEEIFSAAVKHKAFLVGLSALMTTTLKSMEETVNLIKNGGLDCKIVVGGAVLTPEYAQKIGADFYAKDAKAAVDIANGLL